MKLRIDYSPASKSKASWDFVFSDDINDHMPKKRHTKSEQNKQRYARLKASKQPAAHQPNRLHAMNDMLSA